MDYNNPPCITYIGSSHVRHMGKLKLDQTTTEAVASLLTNSHFVGVGGLKWCTCADELNGIFKSSTKARKYGNQWEKYDGKGVNCHYQIPVLGSLKPHIDNFYLDLKNHVNDAKLGYVPILPRYWWHKLARQFALDLDFYVCAIMPKKLNIKVKRLTTRSLY